MRCSVFCNHVCVPSAEFVAAMSDLAAEWGWRGSAVAPDSPYVVRQSKNNRCAVTDQSRLTPAETMQQTDTALQLCKAQPQPTASADHRCQII